MFSTWNELISVQLNYTPAQTNHTMSTSSDGNDVDAQTRQMVEQIVSHIVCLSVHLFLFISYSSIDILQVFLLSPGASALTGMREISTQISVEKEYKGWRKGGSKAGEDRKRWKRKGKASDLNQMEGKMSPAGLEKTVKVIRSWTSSDRTQKNKGLNKNLPQSF